MLRAKREASMCLLVVKGNLEKTGHLQNETADQVTWNMEKADVLKESFTSVFTGRCSRQRRERAGTGKMKN